MAENEDGQEKSLPASEKKLRKAREEKGQVPRSAELGTSVGLLACSGTLLVLGARTAQGVIALLESGLTVDRHAAFAHDAPAQLMGRGLWQLLHILAPFMAFALVSVFIAPKMVGGLVFSTDKLKLDFTKLNPVAGLKKMFSIKAFMELPKSLAKVAVVGGVALWVIWHKFDDLMNLGGRDIHNAIVHSFSVLGWSFLEISLATLLIAAIDVPFQKWSFARQMRMTKEEKREEAKEDENIENKKRIHRVRMEAYSRRMMAEVPKADVVVTNPTHFAVALRYDDDSGGAPRVVAKGADLIAMQIRTVAREHQVAIFEAPPLARALYYSTELDQEIPAGLYLAVAQVLAYVYQLKRSIHGEAGQPNPPRDLEVPDEFLRDA